MKPNVSLFLDSLEFAVVFRFAEALHEGFEPFPAPVGLRQGIPEFFVERLGGPHPIEGGSCAIVIQIIGTLDHLIKSVQLLMPHLPIQEQPSVAVPSHAVMLEGP